MNSKKIIFDRYLFFLIFVPVKINNGKSIWLPRLKPGMEMYFNVSVVKSLKLFT